VRTAADTNVLVRAAVMDVPVQGAIAADAVALTQAAGFEAKLLGED
jgi:hypothetical protein